MRSMLFLFGLIGASLFSCQENSGEPVGAEIKFQDPVAVIIQGYNGNVMEPFLSRDGSELFFNNLNTPTENTNLHGCVKINDTLFQYNGELQNVNTESLEGVPTMDRNSVLYYVYTGAYEQTLSTIYQGQYSSGSILNPELVENISLQKVGWVNFDVEVSNDGNTLYFVDGRFDENGGPYEADLVMAKKEGGQFFRANNSEKIFQKINTGDLEYAAAISKNELEICFTRVSAPLNAGSEPKIFIASRSNKNEPFSHVQRIEQITGFAEGPTYTEDDKGLYYHKKVNGVFRLFLIEKEQ